MDPRAVIARWSPRLLPLLALACSSAGPGRDEPRPRMTGTEITAAAAPVEAQSSDFAWRLQPTPPRDLDDGAILFFGEGETAPTRAEALERATAAALASASRMRESKLHSVVVLHSREVDGVAHEDFLEETHLNSDARFFGARSVDEEVQGQEPELRARVLIRLVREQVYIGDELRAIWQAPREAWPDELRQFVRAARARRDADAQALGLQELLRIDPRLDELLESLDLAEDNGHGALALRIAQRWSGRIPDPDQLLAQRASALAASMIDADELLYRLERSLQGARRSHTSVRASTRVVQRDGPEAVVRLYGELRAGQPVSFLWMDSASISAPAHLALAGREVEARFERQLVDWREESAGYVRGPVTLAVLAGDAGDPAPRLEPELELPGPNASLAPEERERLLTYTRELQEWLRRGENEAVLLHWEQR